MRRQYTAVYIKDKKWYIGYCVEIPGCATQGRTLASCRKNLLDAVGLMVEVSVEELAEDINMETHVEGLIAGETKDIEQLLKKSGVAVTTGSRKTFYLEKLVRKNNSRAGPHRNRRNTGKKDNAKAGDGKAE